MKRSVSIVFVVGLLVSSCAQKPKVASFDTYHPTNISEEIPAITVDMSALDFTTETSLWSLNDQLYSGYAVGYHQDGTLKEKTGFWKGKKQHQAMRWYPDGHIQQVSTFHQGKLHGTKKIWGSEGNHLLVAHYNFHLGKAHGAQTKWYPTGELYQKLQLNMGKEEGMQQAFRTNGDLYANYEAKNGRIFGLKKASLCFGLEDEKMQSKK